MLEPTNAAAFDEQLEVSKVYVLRGSESTAQPVAESVARQMGGLAVSPLPVPPPVVGAFEGLGDASVVVMLGADLAGAPLPGPPDA